MPAELFNRRASGLPLSQSQPTPDAAFAARPRLIQLHDALTRAVKQLRPARWNEPAVFFFNRKRQEELEAARPEPPERCAELAKLIVLEMPGLIASVEVRRVARTIDGFASAALALASHCPAAKELAELLAVPDDEVFVALGPQERIGVRLHVRGVADMAQFHRLLAPALTGTNATADASFQLFKPPALLEDGSLPTGFSGCEHWLWPTQPLAGVPRIGGERVVIVGPAFVRASLEVDPRFPNLVIEARVIQTLNAFQVTERLSGLIGRPLPPLLVPSEQPTIARAA
ncbi:MAG: hypothetical protein L0241_14665 [Planctomycetia bacterium]|nr:hypothetical protein [Planctomycetia bacterium]